MEIIRNLSSDITSPLERFRGWLMEERIQTALLDSLGRKPNKFQEAASREEPTSLGYLNAIDHPNHIGYPLDMHGIDLNYTVLQKDSQRIDASLFDEVRRRDIELDNELQMILGARFCALKAFYPHGGHIGWHTNWNAAGYNIIFTHSTNGDGYWRHIEPTGKANGVPDTERMVHVQDSPGWHCKVGYFGSKAELDKILWHCAYTNEPRVTVGYVIYDKGIWENMVEELKA